jgi:hypothetical protein
MKKTILSLGFIYALSNIPHPTGALLCAVEACYPETKAVFCEIPIQATGCEIVNIVHTIPSGVASTDISGFNGTGFTCGQKIIGKDRFGKNIYGPCGANAANSCGGFFL